jgi:hypothetical protein
MEGGEEDGDLYNFHSSLTAPMKVLCVISVGRERVDMDRLCRGASPRLACRGPAIENLCHLILRVLIFSASPKSFPNRGSPLSTSSMSPKDEESPADYNYGGYLQVKLSDLFKDGRYSIVRKLG